MNSFLVVPLFLGLAFLFGEGCGVKGDPTPYVNAYPKGPAPVPAESPAPAAAEAAGK